MLEFRSVLRDEKNEEKEEFLIKLHVGLGGPNLLAS